MIFTLRKEWTWREIPTFPDWALGTRGSMLRMYYTVFNGRYYNVDIYCHGMVVIYEYVMQRRRGPRFQEILNLEFPAGKFAVAYQYYLPELPALLMRALL